MVPQWRDFQTVYYRHVYIPVNKKEFNKLMHYQLSVFLKEGKGVCQSPVGNFVMQLLKIVSHYSYLMSHIILYWNNIIRNVFLGGQPKNFSYSIQCRL